MCGLTAAFDYGKRSGDVRRETVDRMRDTLLHRGPDGAGTYVSDDARVGLGHRRLSIVDPAGGAQPMRGADGAWLAFNGEIYNYPATRRLLEADGAVFATDCDTEIILKLYERHGLDCLEHMDGMFAFALWDPAREHLFFARDRAGEKPLYWTEVGGRLLVASEIKALLAHPGVTAEVNEDALLPYLTNLVSSSPETLYAGIWKLPPGWLGVCDGAGVKTHPYWDVFAPRQFGRQSLPEASAHVRELLETSVHERLMSDVPVGVLLSGGLDSSTLVALLADHASEVSTFSVGYTDHPDLDERAIARKVASHFGHDHHEIALHQADAIEFLPRLVHHQDEPLADPVCMPLNFVCQLAQSKGVKVVLAGEGADELFWGYPTYTDHLRRWRWIRPMLSLPRPLRSRLPRLIDADDHPYFHGTLSGIASGRPLPMHMPLGLSSYHRQRVVAPSFRAGQSNGWHPSSDAGGSSLHRLAFDTQEYEFGLRLPELLLMRIDRFSMANSIEARVPFLSRALIEYAYRLPLEVKAHGGQGKLVLREAVKDIVPDWVMNRRKQGFGAPVLQWMMTEMGDVFRNVLLAEPMRRYFDVEYIAGVLDARASDPVRASFSLWPVMNFALWHRYWIEGEKLLPGLE